MHGVTYELPSNKKPVTVILRVQVALADHETLEDVAKELHDGLDEIVKRSHDGSTVYVDTLEGWDYG